MKHPNTSFCSVVSLAGLLLGALTLLAAVPAAAQPPGTDPSAIRIDQKLDAQTPLDAVFTDETGKTVKFGDYFDKRPAILVMPFYRCSGMCTLELEGLIKACNGMSFTAGKDFSVIVVSIDPKEKYTLAAGEKKQYLEEYNRPEAAGGWHFLTGDTPNIQRLAQAVGYHYVIDPKSGQPNHPIGLMFLTPEGKVSRYMFGVDYTSRDTRLALVDASGYKIGSLSEYAALACTHYDPHTGKFTVAIDRIIKFACTATVLVLGTFMLAMFRMERNRAHQMATQGVPSDTPPDTTEG